MTMETNEELRVIREAEEAETEEIDELDEDVLSEDEPEAPEEDGEDAVEAEEEEDDEDEEEGEASDADEEEENESESSGAAEASAGPKKRKRPKRVKDVPAQLRSLVPFDMVTEEWIQKMADKRKWTYENAVIYYMWNDYLIYLIADWRDAEDVLKALIREMGPHLKIGDICRMIDNITRGYDDFTTFSGLPIPDPVRLAAFVNEVVESVLAVESYRREIEAVRCTTIHDILRSEVMDRLLPKPTQMVLQRACVLCGDGRIGPSAA